MKKMLLLCLCIPFFSFSQKNKFLESMLGLKSDSTSQYVKLPPLWRSDFYKLYEVGMRSSYRYVIPNDTIYYKVFSRYSKDSLPVIDFEKKDLFVSIACSQCLVYCRHDDYWDNQPCHRNACGYSVIWSIRDKRKESGRNE